MKIAIDPGHGMGNRGLGTGYDPGACAGGLAEADIVLQWGLTLNWVLRQAGVDAYMTRDDDTDVTPVSARDNRALEAGCTHLLSLHANAGPWLASGVETFYRDSVDRKFAALVHAAALEATGLRDRGIRHESQTAVKRLAVMAFPGPCALLEIGYITNPKDRKVMASRETRLRFAQALLKRIR